MNGKVYILLIFFCLLLIIGFSIKNTIYFKPIVLSSNEDYINCLLDLHDVFQSLSVPWFLTFGTALSYWRSKNFLSHDIDVGIFSDNLFQKKITDKQLVSIMTKKFNFIFRRRLGQIDHGQEWSFLCPKSFLTVDIFVFYPLNPIYYWSATYTGICDKMRYKKCRWKYRKFEVKSFEINKKQFFIVPLTFIKERYGKNYTIKQEYDYHESLKFLPNLINESDEQI